MPICVVFVTTKQKEEYVDKLKTDNPDAKIVILSDDTSNDIENSRLLMRFAPILWDSMGTGRNTDHERDPFTSSFSMFEALDQVIFRDFNDSHRDYDEEKNAQDDHTRGQGKQKTRFVRSENKRSLICNKGTAPFQHKKNFVRSKKTKPFR
jgi:hypothetical protein